MFSPLLGFMVDSRSARANIYVRGKVKSADTGMCRVLCDHRKWKLIYFHPGHLNDHIHVCLIFFSVCFILLDKNNVGSLSTYNHISEKYSVAKTFIVYNAPS